MARVEIGKRRPGRGRQAGLIRPFRKRGEVDLLEHLAHGYAPVLVPVTQVPLDLSEPGIVDIRGFSSDRQIPQRQIGHPTPPFSYPREIECSVIRSLHNRHDAEALESRDRRPVTDEPRPWQVCTRQPMFVVYRSRGTNGRWRLPYPTDRQRSLKLSAFCHEV